ncbi:MAG: hypothetical protein EPN22_06145 [Nitrospirae bacterium]|nr:MAG: hypothetical protein EPN22_06145 [Nitrospirota bacterium]
MNNKISEHRKTNTNGVLKHLGVIAQILFRHNLTGKKLHPGTRSRLIESVIYVEKNKDRLPVDNNGEIDRLLEETRYRLSADKIIRQREQSLHEKEV